MPDIAQAPRKRVTVLGSTGSIGMNTLKLLTLHKNRFEAVALTAEKNVAQLARQAREIGAKRAVIGDDSKYGELKTLLIGSGIEAAAGRNALIEAASMPSDIVVAAIVGAAGLLPTMAALERGATVALANKECLVCAGDLMTRATAKHGATLLPVDSEHSAIFQVFDFVRPESVSRILITASGGPFRTRAVETLASVTPEEAVRHPNWSMGAKISVDSATMMNKGLEVIEAYHLFPVEPAQIEVVIHPESIIHSMVEYIDGSVLAQMGTPDMRTPIAYALAWPERIHCAGPKLDFTRLSSLHFEMPDHHRFPALALARAALEAGGSAPAILNAANEVAVARFLRGDIRFTDIVPLIAGTLDHLQNAALNDIADVLEIDRLSRLHAESA